MHSNNQHGRQPPLQQTAPPSDPRTRNLPTQSSAVEASSGICRDFIWGICTLGAQCKYRHDLEYDAMKAVLKFCHDHQNRTGCTRPDCSYLHTSREEENAFLTVGTIPRLLYDRYLSMGSVSATAQVAPAAEIVQGAPTHNMMYEYIAQPPPPPPPPPAMSQTPRQSVMQAPLQPSMMPMQPPMLNHMQGPLQISIQGPMQGTMHGPMQGPMQGPMHGPMQGPMPLPVPMPVAAPQQTIPTAMPPPPPPPLHSSAAPIRVASSAYTGLLPPQQNMTSHYHGACQQSLPPMFDPTRPPPPIPQASTSRASKRPSEDCEAGPSKLRKSDSSNDSSCESCVQRLIRIGLYNQQIDQLQQETEEARLDITSKMEDYERKKQILKSVIGPEMYRRMLDVVENGPSSPISQWGEMFTPSNMFTNSLSSTSANTSNAIHQLVDMLIGNNTRGLMEPMPSTSSDDALLQQLSAQSWSHSGATDAMNTLLDLIRNVSAPERTPGETRTSEPEHLRQNASASSNGFNRFMVDSASTSGPSAGRFASGRPYGDSLGAGPSNPTASARSYGDGGVVPATLTASGAGPAPIRPYLENAVVPANPHPYADNVSGSVGAPYVDGLAGPLTRPYADNVAGGPRYHPTQAPPPRQYHPGLCEGATVPTNAPPAAAPPTYMPGSYSPANLPATRTFYAQGQHGPPNNMPTMPNPPYPGVVMSQAPRPSMPPQNVQNHPYFMGVRYPNQHYYPPYQ